MQKHQKEPKESKNDNKVETEDKKELTPFVFPPFFVPGHYSPLILRPTNSGPMKTSYLSGAASFAGYFEGPFNDDAKRLMGLSDQIILDNLRNTHDRGITNVYFKDPAGPLGNIFAQNGLKPLTAIWKPSKIEIFDIKVQSTALAEKFFTNHLDRQVTYKAEISYETAQTTTSGWSKEFSESLGRSANAGIDIKFISAGVTIETTQTTTIGQSQEFSRTITLGSSSAIEVPVRAFESIRAELTASLGTAKARVTYDIQLDGYLVAYGPNITGMIHSYWFSFPKRATVEQVLEINSYGRDYIQVFPWDPNSPR